MDMSIVDPLNDGLVKDQSIWTNRFTGYPLNFLSTNSPANALAASGGQQTLNLVGNNNEILVITHWSFISDGNFLFQLTPSDLGAGLFYNYISSQTILSLLQEPGRLPCPIVVVGTGAVRVDMTNDNGAVANNVRFTFWGYRKLPKRGCNVTV